MRSLVLAALVLGAGTLLENDRRVGEVRRLSTASTAPVCSRRAPHDRLHDAIGFGTSVDSAGDVNGDGSPALPVVEDGINDRSGRSPRQIGRKGRLASPSERVAASRGPVLVDAGVRVRDVSFGQRLCVLSDEGRVRCGSTTTSFEGVPLPDRAIGIAAGLGGSCARLASGQTACWDCPNTTRPLLLPLPKMKNLTVGETVACGVLGNGSVKCWGDLICNPVASGELTMEPLPTTSRATQAALSPDAFWARAPSSIISSDDLGGLPRFKERLWVLGVDGVVRHKGKRIARFPRAVDVQVSGVANEGVFAELMERHDRGCALLADGRVGCWGDNRFGQSWPINTFPVRAKQLAIGPDHDCALLVDGSVVCWGANPRGALGFVSETGCPGRCRYDACAVAPARVAGLNDVVRVRAGPRHPPFTCAITRSGRLSCWGTGYGLELPGATVDLPVYLGALQCEPKIVPLRN